MLVCRNTTLVLLGLIASIFCSSSVQAADGSLTIGTVDNQSYGFNFDGVYTHTDEVLLEFTASRVDLDLTVSGYDIDFTNEVEVFVNQQSVGYLRRSRNNRSSTTRFSIPADTVRAGTNELLFRQRVPGYTWGVSDVLIEGESTPVLTMNTTDTGNYGFNFASEYADSRSVTFNFDRSTEDLALAFTAFDIDFNGEVTVSVNGSEMGNVPVTGDNASADTEFLIPASMQQSGSNAVVFTQAVPGYQWGISDLRLSTRNPEELAVGVEDTNYYGYTAGGVNSYRESVSFSFEHDCSNLYLSVRGHDIDEDREVLVLLNGHEIGTLERTANNSSGVTEIVIGYEDQDPGINTITFQQTSPGYRWGVSNISIEM